MSQTIAIFAPSTICGSIQSEFANLHISSTKSSGASYLLCVSTDKKSIANKAVAYLQKSPTTKALFVFSINQKKAPTAAFLKRISELKKSHQASVNLLSTGDLIAPTHRPNILPSGTVYLASLSSLMPIITKSLFSYGIKPNTFYATKLDFPPTPNQKPPSYNLKNTYCHPLPFDHALLSLPSSPPKPRINKKPIFASLILLFWFITVPFLLIFASGTSLAIASKNARQGNTNKANQLSKLALHASNLSKSGFLVLSHVPVVNHFTQPALETSTLLENSSHLALRLLNLGSLANSLIASSLNDDNINLEDYSNTIFLESDLAYKELSFIEANLNNLPSSLHASIPEISEIPKLRRYLHSARDLATTLPSLLGADSQVTYLVLFQNNMELRPTGGFIGSFALATVQNGKLIDLPVYDVYSADGQLKGYIEPPDPIVQHLNEETWFLRDSNWDPDYPLSAKRAEWFLDKSLDQKVDGVIAIDLEFLRSTLAVTGPVHLADFNDTISTANFYQKIQHEVEADFFPGSRKKANYLTAVANKLLEASSELAPNQELLLAKNVLASLNTKSIQLYLHDSKAQSTASILGWTGEVNVPTCINNCQALWYGLVEANLGVNKSNLYIDRESQITIDVLKESTVGNLTVNFTNTSKEQSRIPEFRYKNYLRLLLPKEAVLSSVTVTQASQTISLVPDIVEQENHLEAGILLDINPSSSAKISYIWSQKNKFKPNMPHGRIELSIRKQPGVAALPTTIFLRHSTALTQASPVRYTTTLSEDYHTIYTW